MPQDISNTVIPSEASCFTVKHDAKLRDLLLRLWRSRGGSHERLAVVAAEGSTARGL